MAKKSAGNLSEGTASAGHGGMVSFALPPEVNLEPDGPQVRHLNIKLNRRQMGVVRRLRYGLYRASEKLDDGRPVFSTTDAVKWLVDKVGGTIK